MYLDKYEKLNIMQISKKTPKSRKLVIVITIVIIVALAAGAFLYKKYVANDSTSTEQSSQYERKIDLDKPTDDQVKAGQTTKEQSLSKDSSNTNPSSPDTSFIITAKNVNASSSILQIRTLLSEIVSQGTCTLTLTKGSSSVSRSVATQAGPADSTCQGFDIPLSELSNGTWNIKITLVSQNINKVVEDKIDVSGI